MRRGKTRTLDGIQMGVVPRLLPRCIGLVLVAVISPGAADEYYEPVHYKCDGPRVTIWAQELWNEEGRNFRYFDSPHEGAYNPNSLVHSGKPDTVVRKRCEMGRLGVFQIAISPGGQCQGQVVPQVDIHWNDSTIFRAREFGSNCFNVKAPYFVEADATSRRITIGYVDGQPTDAEGKPFRFSFTFPETPQATKGTTPSENTVESDARKGGARPHRER